MSEYCKNCKEMADRMAQVERKLRDVGNALSDYNTAARKFIRKVQTGKAQSKETYSDLLRCLDNAIAALDS